MKKIELFVLTDFFNYKSVSSLVGFLCLQSHFNKGLTCYLSMGPNSCSSEWILRPGRDVTFSGCQSLPYSQKSNCARRRCLVLLCLLIVFVSNTFGSDNGGRTLLCPGAILFPIVLLESWAVVVGVQCSWKLCTSSQWLLPYQIGCTSLFSLWDCCILGGF